MKIVIDFRNTYKSNPALSVFTNECWQNVAALQPEHAFIFTGNHQLSSGAPAATNITTLQLTNTGITWFDQKKIKKTLASWQADRFVTIRENAFYSKRVSQQKQPIAAPEQWLFLAANADVQPLAKPVTPAPVVTFIRPAFAAVNALSWAEAESIKTQYTGGRSFFLFTGNIGPAHQLVELLKAFSIFKKWQQSNMQLVIAGYTTAWTQVLEEKLLTYKYRSDVVILQNISTSAICKLAAASYAMLYPSAGNIFPFGLLCATSANKAVIATDNPSNRNILPAAEWVAENNSAEGFAKAMILLYKDEKRQQLLAQQARVAAEQYSRRQMLTAVWQCLEK